MVLGRAAPLLAGLLAVVAIGLSLWRLEGARARWFGAGPRRFGGGGWGGGRPGCRSGGGGGRGPG